MRTTNVFAQMSCGPKRVAHDNTKSASTYQQTNMPGTENGCQLSKVSVCTDGYSHRLSFLRHRITSQLGTRTQDCHTTG